MSFRWSVLQGHAFQALRFLHGVADAGGDSSDGPSPILAQRVLQRDGQSPQRRASSDQLRCPESRAAVAPVGSSPLLLRDGWFSRVTSPSKGRGFSILPRKRRAAECHKQKGNMFPLLGFSYVSAFYPKI